MNKNTF